MLGGVTWLFILMFIIILILVCFVNFQEELKKRREQEEKHAKEEEFLRTSLRGSKKLQALENRGEESPSLTVTGFVNDAYDVDEDKPYTHPKVDATIQKPVGKL